ncbi:hypothetical protein BDR26DRAFT_302426 [Obelidium mucronatum]|nr:hypothetical protein BDR26DRAFT_302426 [Obelidium mucronatum]
MSSDDFESCLNSLRHAHSKALAASEIEVSQLRSELVRKDNELKDLASRLSLAESQLADMSRTVQKLAAFKQNVVASLGEEFDPKANSIPPRSPFEDPQNEVTTRFSRIQTDTPSILNHSPQYHRVTAAPQQREEYSEPRPQNFSREYSSHSPKQIPSNSGQPKTFHQQHQLNTSLSSLAQGIILNAGHSVSAGYGGVAGGRSDERNDERRERSERTVAFSIDKLDIHEQDVRPNNNHQLRAGDTLGSNSGGGVGSSASNHATTGLGSVDGREFFKLARSRLSYDDFTNLLNNVKAYNARDQSRIRTLENMRSLLGDRHRDLYDQFEQLLSR